LGVYHLKKVHNIYSVIFSLKLAPFVAKIIAKIELKSRIFKFPFGNIYKVLYQGMYNKKCNKIFILLKVCTENPGLWETDKT